MKRGWIRNLIAAVLLAGAVFASGCAGQKEVFGLWRGHADLEPLKSLEITYANTTGPLRMKIDEVRRTGIEIGIGQTREGRLVYEFDVKFGAAPSLDGLQPGMVVGVGLLAGASKSDGPMGPGGKRWTLEVWLKVRLPEHDGDRGEA